MVDARDVYFQGKTGFHITKAMKTYKYHTIQNRLSFQELILMLEAVNAVTFVPYTIKEGNVILEVLVHFLIAKYNYYKL